MKTFYVVGNSEKDRVVEIANHIKKLIEVRSGICYIGYGFIDRDKLPGGIDCIITLGGDGTLIRVARDVAGSDIALLGVNLGHLGYLTSVSSYDEIEDMVDRLFAEDYSIEDRMMLDGVVHHNGVSEVNRLALNEVVITNNAMVKFMKCRVYVNSELLNDYKADGIIISTPTGSTAYNLSAGGPIVEPGARMFIITPVCPHALNRRSVVLAPESVIEVEMFDEVYDEKLAVFDGDEQATLRKTDKITIRESKVKTRLIKLRGGTFLDNLREKMQDI